MNLSEIVTKIIGLILAIVGLALILSIVGVSFLGVALAPWWLALLVGVVMLDAGILIIRGGNISL